MAQGFATNNQDKKGNRIRAKVAFAVAAILILGAIPGYTIVVEFDDEDREPSASLNIWGVAVTGYRLGNGFPVATIAGQGLGTKASGGDGTVDRQVSFEAGSGGSVSDSGPEGVRLSVNGKINSITIQTYFSVLSGPPASIPFEMSFYPLETGGTSSLFYDVVYPDISHAIRFQDPFLPATVLLDLGTDFGVVPMFFGLRSELGFPESSYQYGFSIKSIDYTPDSPLEPIISDISDTRIKRDGALVAVPFKVRDLDSPAESLTLTVTSSEPGLVPVRNIIFHGSGPDRTITVTPLAHQSGSTLITVTVRDEGGLAASESFLLTVEAENDPPTISKIVDRAISEDTVLNAVPFSVADVETSADDLGLAVTSSNPLLIPVGNITLGGSGNDRTITVTPLAHQSGSTLITVTVRDEGGLAASESFLLTVQAENDPPTISDISDNVIDEDSVLNVVVTIADVETSADHLGLEVTSSNPLLVPITNISWSNSGGVRAVAATPLANQWGSSVITLKVRDEGGLTAVDSFVLTVNPVNDAPTLTPIRDQIIFENSTTGDLSFDIGDIDSPLTNLTVIGTSSDETLVPNANVAISISGTSGKVTVAPLPNQSGRPTTIILSLSDGQDITTEEFLLTVTAKPPKVKILNPLAKAVYVPNQPIFIEAQVETSRAIKHVEFFATQIRNDGTRLEFPLGTASSAPYAMVWFALSANEYILRARVTDDRRVSSDSESVEIVVSAACLNLQIELQSKRVFVTGCVSDSLFDLQESNNLTEWTSVSTNRLVNGYSSIEMNYSAPKKFLRATLVRSAFP